jgi:hypothetical protein
MRELPRRWPLGVHSGGENEKFTGMILSPNNLFIYFPDINEYTLFMRSASSRAAE